MSDESRQWGNIKLISLSWPGRLIKNWGANRNAWLAGDEPRIKMQPHTMPFSSQYKFFSSEEHHKS